MIGLSSLMAATLWQAAVPPPVEQQTADCARPVYAVDRLICADPALRAEEDQLAAAWRDVRPLPADDWLEDQSVWFDVARFAPFRPVREPASRGPPGSA